MPFPKIGQAIVASAVVLGLLGGYSTAQTTNEPVSLEDTKWSAIGLNGGVLDMDKRPEIAFAAGGAFGGSGGCNRIKGQVEISDGQIDFPDNIAATLMACPPEMEQVERQFLDALQNVTAYAVAGDNLVMLDSAGEPVLKFVRMP
ncbi:META domain-containing protein [Ruegeria arenilitoris]|uniref:META domain-containing protein n=1 Tax=Ruegeria arenilitoris TaxID=1173585 RepID=UPI0014814FF0|nr:META domain-containing protein [Ruegeria arenilitoris]